MKTQHPFLFSKGRFVGVLVLVLLLSAMLAALLKAQRPFGSTNQAATGFGDLETQQRMRDFKEFIKKHSDASGVLRQDLWLQGIEHFKHMKVSRSTTLPPSLRTLQAETLTLQWQQIGPQPVINSNIPPFSGEVTDIAIDPRGTTDQWIYIATNDGGIWKTTDGGTTWFPKTDFMPSNSMGAVVLDPDNPSIVYAGTGNAFNNGFFKGIGVYKSTDGGETWTIPGGTKAEGNPLFKGKAINRIVVPGKRQKEYVLVGTNGGLFQSSNGGRTYGSNFSAFDNQQPIMGGNITDIDVDTEAPNIVYACSSGVGLFTLIDNGFGYMVLRQNFPEQPLPGLGYLSFAQSTKPTANTMYLNAQVGNQAKLFRSFEHGFDWQDLGQIDGAQLGYDQTIGVDPQYDNIVYAGLIYFLSSADAGQHFARKGATVVHGDHHALAFSSSSHTQGANSPTRIWVGTDGGIYSSINAGDTWSDLNNTLATNLLRAIDMGRGKDFNRGFTYGGAQDNGTSEHRPDLPGNTWHEALEAYGDGDRPIVDPVDARRAYSFIGIPFLFKRTTDGGRSWSLGEFNGQPSAGPPLAVDPKNTSIVYASGGNFIIRSTNRGENFKLIYAFPQGSGTIQAVSLSQKNPSVMWVGMSNGTVQRSTNLLDANGEPNDNPTYTPHTVNGAPAAAVGAPQGIAVDPTNDNEAVVVYEGLTKGQGHAFQVRTDENGVFLNNDTNISGTVNGDSQNLPNLPLHAVVIDSNPDPITGQLPIIVASDAGILRTTDAGPNGAHWQVFGPSLPIVDCTSLAIDSSINPALLRVGTYGRSAFELKYLRNAPIDVTAQMKFSRTGFRFDQATHHFVQDVTFTNRGSSPIQGPVFLVLDGLDSNIRLVNNNGVTGNVAPLGSPYIFLTGNPLPQDREFTRSLEFTNPGATGITYSIRFLAGGDFP